MVVFFNFFDFNKKLTNIKGMIEKNIFNNFLVGGCRGGRISERKTKKICEKYGFHLISYQQRINNRCKAYKFLH
jgi:hypothetical protein